MQADPDISFSQCMVAQTVPMYWGPDPINISYRIYDLLQDMILQSPDSALLRTLPTQGSTGSERSWLRGEPAVAWLRNHLETIMLPLAGKYLADPGSYEEVFDELTEPENVIRVFFDQRALRLALGADVPGGAQSEETSFYCTFTSDWSSTGDSIIWSPQILTMSAWPASDVLGPNLTEAPPVLTWSAEESSRILESTLYKQGIGQALQWRVKCKLGSADFSIPTGPGGYQYLLQPVFYAAFPSGNGPASAEDMLQNPWRSALQTLAEEPLGVRRIHRRSVAAGILDGHFFTHRRDLSGRDAIQAYYLMVDSRGSTDRQSGEEAVARISDWFAYMSTLVSSQMTSTIRYLREEQPRVELWNASLRAATDLTHRLRELSILHRLSPRDRRRTTSLLKQLSQSFDGTPSRVGASLHGLDDARDEWEGDVGSYVDLLTDRLTVQAIRDGAREGERLRLDDAREWPSVKASSDAIVRVLDSGNRLKNEMQEASTIWGSKLEYEREEHRSALERQNRILSIGLAAIALLTAVPILVGQLSWPDLERELRGWSGFPATVGSWIIGAHSVFLLGASLISIGAVVFFATLFLTGVAGRFTKRRPLVKKGGKLRKAWAMNREAARLLDGGDRYPSTDSAALQRLEELDAKICDSIVEMFGRWRRLSAIRESSADTVRALNREVDSLLLRRELFDNRPSPLWTLRAVCLYRFMSAALVGFSVVPDNEFDRVLRTYGFGLEDRKVLYGAVKDMRTMEPGPFVEALRSMGLNVWRNGWRGSDKPGPTPQDDEHAVMVTQAAEASDTKADNVPSTTA
jgi:hypothetical protein